LPIYNFFKPDVTVQYHDGHLCHFFACAARPCKTPIGGVRRFQDSKDRASTANLKGHAIKCFGEDAVKVGTSSKSTQNGSVFAAFALQGQRPQQRSHQVHTNIEFR
jgi:hypothetical protein